MCIAGLAMQCGEAVVETTELIEKTRKNVETGMKYLKATASSVEIVSEENSSTNDLIHEISLATTEHSDAMKQISVALKQISDITQRNSATASSSAQVSVDMKRQAEQLKELLRSYQFNIL